MSNLLKSFARKLTQNDEDAKDLMQETVLRAYRKRDSYQPGSNFKSWITTIMHNTFISGCRKRANYFKWQKANEGRETPFSIQDRSGEAYSNLTVQEINRYLGTIGDAFSVPFMMHYRGFRYNEIAEELDLPIGTVKSRIFFARRKMIKLLEGSELYVSSKRTVAA